jgi:hypothetical protein
MRVLPNQRDAHFSFLKKDFSMNFRMRVSKIYIGVAYDPAIGKWIAYRGQNTKKILATCNSELSAAKEFNRFIHDEARNNGGFLLGRLNDIPEEKKQPCSS